MKPEAGIRPEPTLSREETGEGSRQLWDEGSVCWVPRTERWGHTSFAAARLGETGRENGAEVFSVQDVSLPALAGARVPGAVTGRRPGECEGLWLSLSSEE